MKRNVAHTLTLFTFLRSHLPLPALPCESTSEYTACMLWLTLCPLQPRNLLPRSRYFLNGFLSSIFIYAVPASRRQQLGMYVGRMSVKSQWAVLKKHGRVTPVR